MICLKVSVIVPVYNVEKYLARCLDSLVNQTLNDIEIIIVNDGSTDNSENIIKQYLKKYSNIKSYTQKNQGQAVARNVGLTHATGKYISYVDSDDYVETNMFKKLYSEIEKNKPDILISNIIKEENGRSYIFKNYWNIKKEPNKNFMTSHMGPVARLYSREFLINNNFKFMEGVIYEDLASIPILGVYTDKIEYIDEAYYHYTIRDGSSMNQKKYNKKLKDIFKVMDNLSANISDDYFEELEYLYTEHLLYSASLRFIEFNKKDKFETIRKIMREHYPKYYKNIYYKNKSIKFKIICFLCYFGFFNTVKFLKRIGERKW